MMKMGLQWEFALEHLQLLCGFHHSPLQRNQTPPCQFLLRIAERNELASGAASIIIDLLEHDLVFLNVGLPRFCAKKNAPLDNDKLLFHVQHSGMALHWLGLGLRLGVKG